MAGIRTFAHASRALVVGAVLTLLCAAPAVAEQCSAPQAFGGVRGAGAPPVTADLAMVVVEDRLLGGDRAGKIRHYEQRIRATEASPSQRALARYQLARLLSAAKEFPRAESLANAAARDATDAGVRARAQALAARIAYRRQVDASESALEGVRAVRRAGRFDEAATGLTELESRPCPYKSDFQDRVRLERAELAIAQDRFEEARALARATSRWNATLNVRSRARAVLEKADVRERAFQVAQAEEGLRAAIVQATARADEGQLAEAIEQVRQARATHGGARPAVIARAGFVEASFQRVRGEYGLARDLLLAETRNADADPALLERARQELFRHDVQMATVAFEEGQGDRAFALLEALEARASGSQQQAQIAVTRAKLWLMARQPEKAIAQLADWKEQDPELAQQALLVQIEATATLLTARDKPDASDPGGLPRLLTLLDRPATEEASPARLAAAEALLRSGFEALAVQTLTPSSWADADRPRDADGFVRIQSSIGANPATGMTAQTFHGVVQLSPDARLRLELARARFLRAGGDDAGADRVLTAAGALPGVSRSGADMAALQVELAEVTAARGDFEHARALLTPLVTSQRARTRQDARDGLLHVEIVRARAMAAAGDYESGQSLLIQAMERTSQDASATALERARIAGALMAADAGRFDEATTVLASTSTDIAMAPAVSDAALQIARKRLDAAARARVEMAVALGRVGDVQAALDALDLIAQDETLDQRWRQQAMLRQVHVLLDEQRFAEAETGLTKIAALDLAPQTEPQMLVAREKLERLTAPLQWDGFVALGGGFETNAPGRRSALRLDDEAAPYPLNQDLNDYFARYAGELNYRQRFGDNASHLRARVGFEAIDQSKLSLLDAVQVQVDAGPVFHLPQANAFVAVSGVYRQHWRGGDAFASETGASVEVRSKAPRNGEAYGGLEWVRRDDERANQDGDIYDARFGFAREGARGGRLGLQLDVERADIDRKNSSYWAPGVMATVSGTTFSMLGMDAAVKGKVRGRYIDFEGRTPLPDGSSRERLERRYEAQVGLELNPRAQWTVEGGYSYLRQSSNIPSRSRDDHLISVGVQRKF